MAWDMMEKILKQVGWPGEDSSPRDRFTWVLDHVYNGNRSAMARGCRCSHTAVVKIIKGERQPGRGLIASLASCPRLNPTWVETGHGSPLLPAWTDRHSRNWLLPISDVLLPGLPTDYQELLSGQVYPVANTSYRYSRYYFRVQDCDSMSHCPGDKIASGDLLLLEADAELWQRNICFLNGRVCAVRCGDGGATIVLVRISCRLEQGGQSSKLCARLPAAAPSWEEEWGNRAVNATSGESLPPDFDQESGKSAITTVSVADVVAVTIKMERML
jgi:hypothetical protein